MKTLKCNNVTSVAYTLMSPHLSTPSFSFLFFKTISLYIFNLFQDIYFCHNILKQGNTKIKYFFIFSLYSSSYLLQIMTVVMFNLINKYLRHL